MDGQKPNYLVFHSNLRRQLTLYKELLAVVREEGRALASTEIKKIHELTLAKESLFLEIQQLEFERKAWNQLLCNYLIKNENDLSFDDVVENYPNEDLDELARLRSTLRVIILKVKELNQSNSRLVENALQETQEMKSNALGISKDFAQTYGPKGKVASSKRENRILSKEI